jgi:hypothetical protein
MELSSIADVRIPLFPLNAPSSSWLALAEVEVAIRSVEGTKLAEDVTPDSTVGFNAVANIVESERSPGKLVLKFTIDLGTDPEVAKIAVAGSAILTGEEQEIELLLAAKEGESVPPVFMRIYQKVYAILYLVSGSLKIPYPSPGLLKKVHVTSSAEINQGISTPTRGSSGFGLG